MATFGDPYDNQYHSTSVQSGKSKRAAVQNQKNAKKNKKAKARGKSVERGNKQKSANKRNTGSKRKKQNKNAGGGGSGVEIGGGFIGILQVICSIAAIGQLIVGIIHTIKELCTFSDSQRQRVTVDLL